MTVSGTSVSKERHIHIAVLLASPVLIFLLNRNWPFQGFGDYDSFFYFGHFIHFPHYQKLQPTYAGERLTWILPGYALVRLLTPVYGTLALHFLAYYAATFSLYSIVKAFSGPQAALLAALALSFHPYFIAANGIDYVMGGCIAYCFLTFAFLVRSASMGSPGRWMLLFLAGLSWAGAVFCYPLWAVFTPACFAVYGAAEQANGRTSGGARLKSIATFAAGGASLILALLLLHRWIYGAGAFPFEGITLGILLSASKMRENPLATKSFSVTYADWLVFPGLTALLSLALLASKSRGWLGMRTGTGLLVAMYLYFAAVMTAMEPRSAILQFDYFASFLIPGAFIVLGVSFFDFPVVSTKAWLWVAVACMISIAPLAKPGLYVKPPILGAVAPGLLLGAALAIRLFRPKSLLAMGLAVLGLGASSFFLAPAVGGIAWRGPGDWMNATRRVAAVVETIEARLPRDKYPVFWFKDSPPHGLEFEAIMCAFLSHVDSMRNFPEVDAGRRFAPGQVVVLLTDERPASTVLPLSLLWDYRIEIEGVSYWVTAMEGRSR
jgi:hypothetical protein